MQRIVPNLWFDTQAKEAAQFYVSAFGNLLAGASTQENGSKIESTITLHDTPSGDVDLVWFELLGHSFMAISAGPHFKINPSISFMVNFDPSRDKRARENLDDLWDKLSEAGTVLMPLGEYPFSKRYGWIEDKFGVTWQLILTDPEGEPRPNIIPSLLFVGDVCGKAEEATEFYLSVFKNSRGGELVRFPKGMPAKQSHIEGNIMFTDFMLEDVWFAAMDSAEEHNFSFNEAISLVVNCDTQQEIDHYWKKLSADPKAEQCGWIKDKFGLSWQIVPRIMDEMLRNGTREQVDRVTQAFLPMKKIVISDLQKAWDGI